jgi:hypothetical protein
MAIWNILRTFGIFFDHLVHFVLHNWGHFSGFGIMYQEKSGNPGPNPTTSIYNASIVKIYNATM